MTPTQRFFRRLKTLLWTAFTLIVISLAVLVGVGKLLLPYSARYQPQLEQWLSQRLGQAVSMQSFTAEWQAFGPRLQLQQLQFGGLDSSSPVQVAEAAIDIRPFNVFIPGRPSYTFNIVGADVEVLRQMDGRFEVRGLATRQEGTTPQQDWSWLINLGQIQIVDSKLQWQDANSGVEIILSEVNATLQARPEELSFAMDAAPSGSDTDSLSITAKLNLDPSHKPTSAEWHVKTRELSLAEPWRDLIPYPLPDSGYLNLEIWGEWGLDQPLLVEGAVDLSSAAMLPAADSAERLLEFERVNAMVRLQRNGYRDWRLDFSDVEYRIDGKTHRSAYVNVVRAPHENIGLWLATDHLDLSAGLEIVHRIINSEQVRWPQFLPAYATGEATDVELLLDADWRPQTVLGKMDSMAVEAWSFWPAMQNLTVEFVLPENGQGNLHWAAGEVVLDWPGMLRETSAFEHPDCTVYFSIGTPQWAIASETCALHNQHLAMTGSVSSRANGDKPFLDLTADLQAADVALLDNYWPRRYWPEKLITWLNRGLKRGSASGRISLFGDLDNWPFSDGSGTFEMLAEIDNGELKFASDWPQAEDLSALLKLRNQNLDVLFSKAELNGLRIEHAHLTMADFRRSKHIALNYAGRGDARGLLGFVASSPLAADMGNDWQTLMLAGPAEFTGNLEFPLNALDSAALTVNGRVNLDNAQLRIPQHSIELDAIRGELRFDRQRIYGQQINALFQGQPVVAQLSVGNHTDDKVSARLQGQFSLAELFGDQISILNGLSDGRSAWSIDLRIPHVGPGYWLQAHSDLLGTTINLPAPLMKTASESWPLRLTKPRSDDAAGDQLELLIEDRLQVFTNVHQQPAQSDAWAHIVFGVATEQAAQDRSGWNVSGVMDALDLDRWLGLAQTQLSLQTVSAQPELAVNDLQVKHLLWLDRVHENVQLQLQREGRQWVAETSSENLHGSVKWQPSSEQDEGSITAQFERLLLGAPQGSGMQVSLSPVDLPPLHIYAQKFAYGALALNDLRIESYPVESGMKFETVEGQSGEVVFRADGEWLQELDQQKSKFNVHMTSESLGELLTSLQIASPIEGGQTLVNLNAWWPGPPTAFGLAELSGELSMRVLSGRIHDAEVGAGRLLGLISIQALPRRLALDFRDVFSTGFNFDEISGSFSLSNGVATTSGIKVDSPIAQIEVSGDTNLVSRSYDQVITIRPGVGQTLPVIGALAGGAGGAAAGVALQGLLQKQLGKAAQVQYHVGGSWDAPVIERLENALDENSAGLGAGK